MTAEAPVTVAARVSAVMKGAEVGDPKHQGSVCFGEEDGLASDLWLWRLLVPLEEAD